MALKWQPVATHPAALSILKWKNSPLIFFITIYPPQSIFVWRPPQWHFTTVRVNYRFLLFKRFISRGWPNNSVNMTRLFLFHYFLHQLYIHMDNLNFQVILKRCMCVLCTPLEELASVVGLLTSVDEELVFYIICTLLCHATKVKPEFWMKSGQKFLKSWEQVMFRMPDFLKWISKIATMYITVELHSFHCENLCFWKGVSLS